MSGFHWSTRPKPTRCCRRCSIDNDGPRAGEVDREPAYWSHLLADLPHNRKGLSARFHAVCDEGYVLYRATRETNVFRGDRAEVIVEELRGSTPDVEAALWRFVLDLDLVGRVTFKHCPVDEPTRWRLVDPRQLRTNSIDDRLYVRILDTAVAFEARGYQAEGRLVLDVLPPCRVRRKRRPGPGTLGARGWAGRRLMSQSPSRRGGGPTPRSSRSRNALHGWVPGLVAGRRRTCRRVEAGRSTRG